VCGKPAGRLRGNADVVVPWSSDDRGMVPTASPLLPVALVLFASILMILGGRLTKRLVMRAPVCPVCRHERKRCTCHWL
jgi:hypothetical protein